MGKRNCNGFKTKRYFGNYEDFRFAKYFILKSFKETNKKLENFGTYQSKSFLYMQSYVMWASKKISPTAIGFFEVLIYRNCCTKYCYNIIIDMYGHLKLCYKIFCEGLTIYMSCIFNKHSHAQNTIKPWHTQYSIIRPGKILSISVLCALNHAATII